MNLTMKKELSEQKVQQIVNVIKRLNQHNKLMH